MAAGEMSPASAPEAYAHLEACSECLMAAAAAARGSAPPADPTHLWVGATIADRFVVRQFLGKGGMGEVLLAHDTVLGELVALKLLRPHVADSDAAIERLRRELVLARRITHRNVCRVYDVGRAGAQPFISMELVAGRSLARCIAGRALGAEAAFAGALQLCAAVQAIHDAGVVHRDLKPSNVLVDHSGRFVVADFGLAADVRLGQASRGQIGTPLYWAPEQLRGEPATTRTDVHAIGTVLDELFRSAMPPQEHARYLPVIRRCTATDPGERFARARDVADALRRAQAATGASAGRRIAPTLLAACLVAVTWVALVLLATTLRTDRVEDDGKVSDEIVQAVAPEPARATPAGTERGEPVAVAERRPQPVAVSAVSIATPAEPEAERAESGAPTLVSATERRHPRPRKRPSRRSAKSKQTPTPAPTKQALWFFET